MRVLLVNDYGHKGGAEIVMHAQRAALADAGHDVGVFAGDAEGLRRSPVSYVDSRRARRLLRERLSSFRPDVVHLHNFYHLLSPGVLGELARWKGVGRAVVMTVHDMHVVCPNPGLLRFDRAGRPSGVDPRSLGTAALLRTRWDDRGWAWSKARAAQHWWNYRLHDRLSVIDAFVAPSAWAASQLSAPGRVVRRVPNPIELRPDGPWAESRDRGPDWTIVFAGRVEPEKGLSEFIGAISGLPVRLRVVGDGADLGRCRDAASEAGVRVDFLGWVDRARARHEIGDADALVLPSRVHENAPLSVFEAIAARTVPIVSGKGGLPEIINEFGVGHVSESEDRDSMRAAVERARASRPGEEDWTRAQSLLRTRGANAYASALVSLYCELGCGS